MSPRYEVEELLSLREKCRDDEQVHMVVTKMSHERGIRGE